MIISAARLLDWRNHHQKVNWHRPLLLWCPRSSSTAGTAIGALGQFTGGMWGTLGNRNPPSWHGKGQWQIQKVQRIWDLPLCNAQLLLKYNKVIDTASYKKDLWAASDSVTQLTCSWYWGPSVSGPSVTYAGANARQNLTQTRWGDWVHRETPSCWRTARGGLRKYHEESIHDKKL